jgi:tRNA(Ile)-lysidine synthase
VASADDGPVPPVEALAAFAPSKGRRGVALAVSGGPDSLALLHLWADARALDPDLPRAVVLTVDHRLRPAARAEAEFVAAEAAARGLEHRILDWIGDKPTANLQAEARAARRRLLFAAAAAEGLDTVILAHQADDQAETFLSRLARGSGVRGLSAMTRMRDVDGLLLFRPFLDLPRARLAATLAARGVTAIEDPSNRDPRHERARLRAAADLFAAHGLTRDRLIATAAAMARASAAIEGAVDALVARAGSVHPLGFARIEATPFAAEPAEIRLRLLSRLIGLFGDAAHGPRLEAVEAIDAATTTTEGSVVRTLGGVRIERRRGALWFAPEAGRATAARLEPGTRLRFGGWVFERTGDAGPTVEIGPLGETERRALRASGGFEAPRLGAPSPSAGLLAGIVVLRAAGAGALLPGVEEIPAGLGIVARPPRLAETGR